MRKPVALLLLSLLPAICHAQKDYCKKIKKTTDNGHTTYKSPELKTISVIKQLKEKPAFALYIHFKDTRQHFETFGAQVTFEDGTTLKDENVKVRCTQEMSSITGSSASSAAGEYLVQGFFSITDDNLPKFTTKKITGVQLHTAAMPITHKDATAIMNYVICMYDLQ